MFLGAFEKLLKATINWHGQGHCACDAHMRKQPTSDLHNVPRGSQVIHCQFLGVP